MGGEKNFVNKVEHDREAENPIIPMITAMIVVGITSSALTSITDIQTIPASSKW